MMRTGKPIDDSLILGMFLKHPVPGKVKTRLGREIGDDASAKLYASFIQELLKKIALVPVRKILAYGPNNDDCRIWLEMIAKANQFSCEMWPQPNEDLGKRMADFFRQMLSREHVQSTLLIGSDSPTIPLEYLEQAFEWLYETDCVVGPSADGGYYAIGLRRYDPEIFAGVNWSSEAVLEQTIERVAKAGMTLKLLPIWYDVDRLEDLRMLRGHLKAGQYSGSMSEYKEIQHWFANWADEANT